MEHYHAAIHHQRAYGSQFVTTPDFFTSRWKNWPLSRGYFGSQGPISTSVKTFSGMFLSRMAGSHVERSALLELAVLKFAESINHSSLNQLVRDLNMFQFFYHHSLLSAEFRSHHESLLLKSLFTYILLLTSYRRLRWFVNSIIFKQLKIKISFSAHLSSYYSSKQRIIFYTHFTKLAQEKEFRRYPD